MLLDNSSNEQLGVFQIAIAGNIGAGKTTLTQLLSRHYNWIPYYEAVDTNPYLGDFYQDMRRWAFNLQIYFLNSRFKAIIDMKSKGNNVIQDRTIYEDAYIFAPNLHEMRLMDTRDYKNYLALFNLMESLVSPPTLLVYLKSTVPHIVKKIKRRGRDYENGISLDYLERLNDYYENWIDSYDKGRLLIIDADEVNFADNSKDLAFVIDKIDKVISDFS